MRVSKRRDGGRDMTDAKHRLRMEAAVNDRQVADPKKSRPREPRAAHSQESRREWLCEHRSVELKRG
jgi:hypothetical protein